MAKPKGKRPLTINQLSGGEKTLTAVALVGVCAALIGGELTVSSAKLLQRQILEAAAVVGRRVDLSVLGEMFPGTDLRTWLMTCANAAVLDAYEGGWRFSHDKLRGHLLAVLPTSKRQSLHSQIATVLEHLGGGRDDSEAQIGYHAEQAGEFRRAATYYSRAGFIANVAVLFNLVLQVAIMSMFGASMTLPGIAGLVLTIGIAVDANVLINERIREELRHGKSPRAAVDVGYDKAFSAIIDGHVTTLISGLILAQYGSGPIKGFAVTLIVGIAASLFTGVVCTRLMFDWAVRARKVKKLYLG